MERLGITYEETVSNLKQSNLQIEQLRKKLEVVTTEYYSLQTEREKRVAELETQLADKSEKLETYEALEKDLDMALISAGQGTLRKLKRCKLFRNERNQGQL
jgi:uncharacterized protein (DUF3084 family)